MTSDAKPGAKACAGALLELALEGGTCYVYGGCYAVAARTARYTAGRPPMLVNSVKRSLGQLREAGWLTLHGPRGGGKEATGRARANAYLLSVPTARSVGGLREKLGDSGQSPPPRSATAASVRTRRDRVGGLRPESPTKVLRTSGESGVAHGDFTGGDAVSAAPTSGPAGGHAPARVRHPSRPGRQNPARPPAPPDAGEGGRGGRAWYVAQLEAELGRRPASLPAMLAAARRGALGPLDVDDVRRTAEQVADLARRPRSVDELLADGVVTVADEAALRRRLEIAAGLAPPESEGV